MTFAQARADLEKVEKQESRKSGKTASHLREASEGRYYSKPHQHEGKPPCPGVKAEGGCSGKGGQALKQVTTLQTKQTPALCPRGCSNLKNIAVCAGFLPQPQLHRAGRSLKHCQSSAPSSSDGPAVPSPIISAPNALSRFKGAQTFAFSF